MAKYTTKELLELVKLLRIDVFFMLAVFSFYMPTVTVNQLSQDKYCMNNFKANESICLRLELHVNDSYTPIRNMVLEKATTLKMYTTIITTVPGILFSLFLGYWVDTYPGHIRYMLAFGPICSILQSLILIYQCFNFDISKTLLLLYFTLNLIWKFKPQVFGLLYFDSNFKLFQLIEMKLQLIIISLMRLKVTHFFPFNPNNEGEYKCTKTLNHKPLENNNKLIRWWALIAQ